jgi:hypothetical protein
VKNMSIDEAKPFFDELKVVVDEQNAAVECESDITSLSDIKSDSQFILDTKRPSDADFGSWDLITLTALFKEEHRKDAANKEIILAYLRAAKCLYACFRIENNPPMTGIKKVYKENQMCMPVLFLCRHTVELAIKSRLPETGHNLKSLWDELKPNIQQPQDVITGADAFVSMLDSLDSDGWHFRYAVDQKQNTTQNQPMFVRADRVVKCTELLVGILMEGEAK